MEELKTGKKGKFSRRNFLKNISYLAALSLGLSGCISRQNESNTQIESISKELYNTSVVFLNLTLSYPKYSSSILNKLFGKGSYQQYIKVAKPEKNSSLYIPIYGVMLYEDLPTELNKYLLLLYLDKSKKDTKEYLSLIEEGYSLPLPIPLPRPFDPSAIISPSKFIEERKIDDISASLLIAHYFLSKDIEAEITFDLLNTIGKTAVKTEYASCMVKGKRAGSLDTLLTPSEKINIEHIFSEREAGASSTEFYIQKREDILNRWLKEIDKFTSLTTSIVKEKEKQLKDMQIINEDSLEEAGETYTEILRNTYTELFPAWYPGYKAMLKKIYFLLNDKGEREISCAFFENGFPNCKTEGAKLL